MTYPDLASIDARATNPSPSSVRRGSTLSLAGSLSNISVSRLPQDCLGDPPQLRRHTRKRGPYLLGRSIGEQIRQLLVPQRLAAAILIDRTRVAATGLFRQIGNEHESRRAGGNLDELPAVHGALSQALKLWRYRALNVHYRPATRQRSLSESDAGVRPAG